MNSHRYKRLDERWDISIGKAVSSIGHVPLRTPTSEHCATDARQRGYSVSGSDARMALAISVSSRVEGERHPRGSTRHDTTNENSGNKTITNQCVERRIRRSTRKKEEHPTNKPRNQSAQREGHKQSTFQHLINFPIPPSGIERTVNIPLR